jgi:hypothetical protein
LITNQPDIARWSRTKSGAMWSQLFTNPIAVTLSASLGILATAAINNKWGLTLWNQWDLLDAIMDHHWTAGARTGVFFAAGGWLFSILGTNIAANMIPFGSDSTMLLPRYLTIPRGEYQIHDEHFSRHELTERPRELQASSLWSCWDSLSAPGKYLPVLVPLPLSWRVTVCRTLCLPISCRQGADCSQGYSWLAWWQ